MLDFEFQNCTKIIFGKAKEAVIGEEVKKYADKILICYGGESSRKSGLLARVTASLKENNIAYFELGGVVPNPRLTLVKEGIAICRQNDIGFILAVGGGSVADTAKAIAAGVPYDGDVWDFYSGKAVLNKALPVAVILTIPATGSEASNSSVITNEDGWLKRNLGSGLIRPVFSILNPELTYTLPPYQTACGAADIMSHVMERYFTNVENVDFTDRLCEATLKTIIENAPKALQNPADYDARAEVMWAGTIAHNDLLGTGRSADWASHLIEMELSAIYDIAHGAGLTIITPAWMKYVYKYNMKRFKQFALRVWDVSPDFGSDQTIIIEGIERMSRFFKSLGLPVTLKEAGIPYDRFEEMALKCTGNGESKIGWGILSLGKSDVVRIYELSK